MSRQSRPWSAKWHKATKRDKEGQGGQRGTKRDNGDTHGSRYEKGIGKKRVTTIAATTTTTTTTTTTSNECKDKQTRGGQRRWRRT